MQLDVNSNFGLNIEYRLKHYKLKCREIILRHSLLLNQSPPQNQRGKPWPEFGRGWSWPFSHNYTNPPPPSWKPLL